MTIKDIVMYHLTLEVNGDKNNLLRVYAINLEKKDLTLNHTYKTGNYY
jgi:hypothetical protein